MKKYTATVIIKVELELDETKFDEAFMAEFRESFYQYHELDEHVAHLAQLEARGLLDNFTEGYGEIDEFGIKARQADWWVEDVEEFRCP
jgi:hypothetical protein